MLFAVFGFGGGVCTPSLQSRLDSIGAQANVVLNDDYALFVDIDALLADLAQLRGEVLQLDGEYELMLERIDSYMAQLRALRTELEQPREIPFEIEFFHSQMSTVRYPYLLRVVADYTNLHKAIHERCPISAVIETYCATFFKENILIVIVVWTSTSPIFINETNVLLEREKINIRLLVSSGQMGMPNAGVMLLELQRRDVRNASILEAFIHRPIVNHEPELVGSINI